MKWSAEGPSDFLQLFDSLKSQGHITQCRSESNVNVTVNNGLSLEGTFRCTSLESGASAAVHFTRCKFSIIFSFNLQLSKGCIWDNKMCM